MPSITIQRDEDISINVKNTFIDVKKEVDAPLRRSNSVPHTFKLGGNVEGKVLCHAASKFGSCVYLAAMDTDASTNASEKDFPDRYSEQDVPDYCSDTTEQNEEAYQGVESLPALMLEQLAPTDTGNSKVRLSLDSMVTEASLRKLRSQAQPFKPARTSPREVMLRSQAQPFTSARSSPKGMMLGSQAQPFRSARTAPKGTMLRSHARTFKSAMTPPGEVMKIIDKAVEVLITRKDIKNARVHHGGMGGVTMIMAQLACAQSDPQYTFSLVKDSLLSSAEQSENTYILGYGTQPFKTLDSLSFSARIAHVPAAHRETECWDYYEKGFCSHCASCCWNHPSEIDMMQIVVMIAKCNEHCPMLFGNAPHID